MRIEGLGFIAAMGRVAARPPGSRCARRSLPASWGLAGFGFGLRACHLESCALEGFQGPMPFLRVMGFSGFAKTWGRSLFCGWVGGTGQASILNRKR